MVTVTGTLDGKHLVLDQAPKGIPPNSRVKVMIVEDGPPTGLDAIAAHARKANLPPDFAAQHHHYTKGLPKR